jgi:hypothetical protein
MIQTPIRNTPLGTVYTSQVVQDRGSPGVRALKVVLSSQLVSSSHIFWMEVIKVPIEELR